MDVLENVLGRFRFSSSVYCRWENQAPWGVTIDGSATAKFHAVRSGRCWVRLIGAGATLLEAGDFVVLPHGDAHDVADDPETPPITMRELLTAARRAGRVHQVHGEGRLVELVCGGFGFNPFAQHPILSFLPKLVHLRASESATLEPILVLIDRELGAARPGSSVVLARLGDILLVETVRAYMRTLQPGEGGWLGAMQDRAIAAVLGAIHADASRDWSLDTLAEKASISRTSLTTRFRALVGVSVSAYIVRWRMLNARTLLEDRELSLGEIAAQVGYGSEAAFNRAFSREMGLPPGELRSRLQQRA
jgi:AraC-like DNA-binding protein